MKTILFIYVLISMVAGKRYCNTCFESFCYTKEVILDNYRLSGQIAIDKKDNLLYFHYEDLDSNDHTVVYDLNEVRLKSIPGIDFSFAHAVDSNGDVYIGGTQGVFKYKSSNNTLIDFGLFDKTIWHMQFKNKIYYTIFMTEGLYTYEKKKSVAIKNLTKYHIDDFVIDKANDVFFVSESILYRYEDKSKQISVVTNRTYSLSIDKYDNVYFIDSLGRGIYKFSHKLNRLLEIGAFDSGTPIKVVFDSYNNIIYYDKSNHVLYYLRPNYGRCKISMVKKRKMRTKLSLPLNRTRKNESEGMKIEHVH